MAGRIETKDVTFAYETEENTPSQLVLDGITLTINEGGFVAVLGHNGSGKSTLAKHFNAILLPVGGKVYIDEMDTSDEESVYDIRQRVGMVFQNPDNQIVATVVEEDVAFALENLGVPPVEIRRRVDEALKNVGMYDYRERAPHQLSGGQKQRVAIAGIIAMRPACIVLDEPTAMLDPNGRHEVIKTIRRLNSDYGITVVLITHYMDEAASADRVVVMESGKVVLDNTPREVFKNIAQLKAIGLDVPQATELAAELREAGMPLPDDILFEDECADAIASALRDRLGCEQ
ncbi:MAG: energy-coupling factor transporter ATPase [Acetanaerobacterium sp.]